MNLIPIIIHVPAPGQQVFYVVDDTICYGRVIGWQATDARHRPDQVCVLRVELERLTVDGDPDSSLVDLDMVFQTVGGAGEVIRGRSNAKETP
jgi:hypothetical protein